MGWKMNLKYYNYIKRFFHICRLLILSVILILTFVPILVIDVFIDGLFIISKKYTKFLGYVNNEFKRLGYDVNNHK